MVLASPGRHSNQEATTYITSAACTHLTMTQARGDHRWLSALPRQWASTEVKRSRPLPAQGTRPLQEQADAQIGHGTRGFPHCSQGPEHRGSPRRLEKQAQDRPKSRWGNHLDNGPPSPSCHDAKPQELPGVGRAGLGTSLMGTAGSCGCRSLGCSAGFARANWRRCDLVLHIAPWLVFPRGECVAMVVVRLHLPGGKNWQQSGVQRPIWVVLVHQDIARKKYRQKIVASWRSREVTMFRDEVRNHMCWT